MGFVVRVFQKLDPQAQAANFDGVGIDVHPEEAVFDDGLLFVEEGFLYALAFFALRVVFKQFAFLVGHDQFVVDHFHVIFLQAPAVAVL